MAAQQRPLSPHLQVYSPQLTSVLSIVHRATGVALAFGGIGLAAWLVSAAGDPQTYGLFQMMANAWYGQLALFGFSFCLMYHLFNGLRHLAWDIGWGFEIGQVYKSGYAVVVLAIASTAAIWFVASGAGA